LKPLLKKPAIKNNAGKIIALSRNHLILPGIIKDMEKEKLTETLIKKLKHRDKQFKLSDGRGLYLLVHPNGSKYWRFDFRFNGKQKSSSLGVWPEVSLSDARLKRNAAKKKINEGVNPIDEKRGNKLLDNALFRKNKTVELDKKAESSNSFHSLLINDASSMLNRKNRTDVNELLINVFKKYSEKDFSEISKEDLLGIFKNMFDDRKKIFETVWEIYPSYPKIQLCVLFILLFFISDLFWALINTSLYLFFSVCFSVGYELWNNKKIDDYE